MQDELIERLGGVDAVAEMSGRKRRIVKQPNGSYKYCLRSSGDVALEKVLHNVCPSYLVLTPMAAYQDGCTSCTLKYALHFTAINKGNIIFTRVICIVIIVIMTAGITIYMACILSLLSLFVPIPIVRSKIVSDVLPLLFV